MRAGPVGSGKSALVMPSAWPIGHWTKFDSVTVGVGDPAGPRSVREARVGRRIGRNTLNGEIGEGGIQ
jgi:hypothetical protein